MLTKAPSIFENNRLEIKNNNLWSTIGVPVALVILCIYFTLSTKQFLSLENMFNILRVISILAITGIGSTFVLISGGIDISISAVMALAGVICVEAMNIGLEFVPAALIAIGVGALIGLCNGMIITKIKIPPFIVTLGTMQIVRGIAYVSTNGYSLSLDTPNTTFMFVGRGYVGVIPVPVIVMILMYCLFWFFANKTVLGQYTYAVGSNEKSSYLFGINVPKVRHIIYMIGGLTSAIAGILLSARLQTALASAAAGMEFDIITAAVLGGVSIYGGKGKLERTLLGAFVIGVINNGMTLPLEHMTFP